VYQFFQHDSVTGGGAEGGNDFGSATRHGGLLYFDFLFLHGSCDLKGIEVADAGQRLAR
jgi:hypothetical protein